MTPGEKRLARRLEALLDDDYLCWYDIPVGRKNRYPDFIETRVWVGPNLYGSDQHNLLNNKNNRLI